MSDLTTDLFGLPTNLVPPGFVQSLPATLNSPAPITKATRNRLWTDARNVVAAAKRKQVSMDAWEAWKETSAAQEHFELGCWLFHLVRLIYQPGLAGFHARIECNYRLFVAGVFSPGYMFFTVFNFGERQFDSVMEMGDAEQVVEALRHLIPSDPTGNLEKAFEYHGWNKTPGDRLRS